MNFTYTTVLDHSLKLLPSLHTSKSHIELFFNRLCNLIPKRYLRSAESFPIIFISIPSINESLVFNESLIFALIFNEIVNESFNF